VVSVDVTTDPLTWPLAADAPSTGAEWAAEWAVIVEKMRAEPASPWTVRYRLPDLADPPADFKRRFLTIWGYAGGQAPRAGIRPAGGGYRALVTRLDELVSGERSRQIRERVAVGADAAKPRPIPPRSADRVRQCREAVARLRRDRVYVTASAIYAATGITREAIAGYVRNGWLVLEGD
jgi:hypothetical protein